MNVYEATAALRADLAPGGFLHRRGIRYEPGAEPKIYMSTDPSLGCSPEMAFDALPTLATEASSGVPMMFTNIVDPQTYEILFAPILVAEAFGGEEQRGSWTDISAMFPVAEATGEVSSYDDYSNSGVSGANVNWPAAEAYLFQTVTPWGELEVARMSVAHINLVAEKERAAASNLNRFANFTYAFGVQGLQNYGTTNHPSLSASLTPSVKAYGGTQWISSGVVRATANEIFTDIQSLWTQLISQGDGNITTKTKATLILPPVLSNALTATNSFAVNVMKLLNDNYPAMKIQDQVSQYAQASAQNPQGIAGGNLVQLVANEVAGQRSAFCAYNEKMRAHPIIREMSAFRQKKTSGTWGAIIRMPFCISSMLGC
jgi:hypothetical protein